MWLTGPFAIENLLGTQSNVITETVTRGDPEVIAGPEDLVLVGPVSFVLDPLAELKGTGTYR